MKNMWGKELKFPEDVYYSEELLWVKDLGGNKVRVGISHIGVRATKKLVHIKMSTREGAQVTKGKPMGYMETSKGIWEIIAPFDGTVIEINPPISRGNASTIAEDSYGDGWLVDMEIAGESDLKALKNGADAETKKWINDKVEEVVPLMHEADDDDDDD